MATVEAEVEQIVDRRKNKSGRVEFLVLWGDGDKTWERRTSLHADVPELVREFERQHRSTKSTSRGRSTSKGRKSTVKKTPRGHSTPRSRSRSRSVSRALREVDVDEEPSAPETPPASATKGRGRSRSTGKNKKSASGKKSKPASSKKPSKAARAAQEEEEEEEEEEAQPARRRRSRTPRRASSSAAPSGRKGNGPKPDARIATVPVQVAHPNEPALPMYAALLASVVCLAVAWSMETKEGLLFEVVRAAPSVFAALFVWSSYQSNNAISDEYTKWSVAAILLPVGWTAFKLVMNISGTDPTPFCSCTTYDQIVTAVTTVTLYMTYASHHRGLIPPEAGWVFFAFLGLHLTLSVKMHYIDNNGDNNYGQCLADNVPGVPELSVEGVKGFVCGLYDLVKCLVASHDGKFFSFDWFLTIAGTYIGWQAVSRVGMSESTMGSAETSQLAGVAAAVLLHPFLRDKIAGVVAPYVALVHQGAQGCNCTATLLQVAAAWLLAASATF